MYNVQSSVMNRFKDLNVWKKAIELTTDVYKITEDFPSKEKFGLISQINRSVVSIPSNIAEGAGRTSKKEFAHFLAIAIGSSFELETQLIITNNIKYINENSLNELLLILKDVQNMLYGLKKSLN